MELGVERGMYCYFDVIFIYLVICLVLLRFDDSFLREVLLIFLFYSIGN